MTNMLNAACPSHQKLSAFGLRRRTVTKLKSFFDRELSFAPGQDNNTPFRSRVGSLISVNGRK